MPKVKAKSNKNTNVQSIENSNLSTDRETEGFDKQAGETWIYPTNYPLRDYQYNIIESALFKNTLVSLPTGLGKTFIAAVVMYNYYRWYPTGKIIFMAPSKPLVKQQIDACYNVMAIPENVTAELTGTKAQTARKDIWKDKRVFFVTAQVLSNDLSCVEELGKSIKCLVFDEAHRAKGNHAYCQVIRKLLPLSKYFRVLALSATPGSTFNDIAEVMHNLLICHIEFRTDESEDVVPYTFKRSLETVVIPIGDKLQQIREDYVDKILEKYTRPLVRYRVIQGNCSNLTKGRIFLILKDFQQKNKTARIEGYSEITRTLNLCITLYHGYELLIRHGLRTFLSFYEEHAEKPLLRGNYELHNILDDIKNYLGPFPNVDPLPDGTTPEISPDVKFGHPKFHKLCDILLAHFTTNCEASSRVIVFCEYRESVKEAYVLLLQQKPLIKPRIFLGQGAMSQKLQTSVIESFRKGTCNTLISTCIGEEGLDVGEVDLIVCFDISSKSPIRMIQRMGRTGRKRQGRIVVLVTEGREQQTLADCLQQKNCLSANILNSKHLLQHCYTDNPRMIPEAVTPGCQKMFITVREKTSTKKVGNTIKGMFDRMHSSQSLSSQESGSLDIAESIDRIPDLNELWDKRNPMQVPLVQDGKLDFSKEVNRLTKLQPCSIIQHSTQTQMLVSLLQQADSKRYNIPITQMPVVSQKPVSSLKRGNCNTSTAPVKQKTLTKTNSFKQADLKSMFLRTASTTTPITEGIIEIVDDSERSNSPVEHLNTVVFPPAVINVMEEEEDCLICHHLFDCHKYKTLDRMIDSSNWTVPDTKILDTITMECLNAFAESLSPESKESLIAHEIPAFESQKDKLGTSMMKEFNKSFKYEPPKNFTRILEKCNESLQDLSQIEPNQPGKISKNKTVEVDEKTVVSFFGLSSIDDLHCVEKSVEMNDSLETVIYSPQQHENARNDNLSPILNKPVDDEDGGSPILCSIDRLKYLKDKTQRKLFDLQETSKENEVIKSDKRKPNLSNLRKPSKSRNSFYSSEGTLGNKAEDLNIDTVTENKCEKQEEEQFAKIEDQQTSSRPLLSTEDFFDDYLLETIYARSKSKNADIEVKSVNAYDKLVHEYQRPEINVLGIPKETKIMEIHNTSCENSFDLFNNTVINTNADSIIKSVTCESRYEGNRDSKKTEEPSKQITEKATEDSYLRSLLDIDDICDLSIFNVTKADLARKTTQTSDFEKREMPCLGSKDLNKPHSNDLCVQEGKKDMPAAHKSPGSRQQLNTSNLGVADFSSFGLSSDIPRTGQIEDKGESNGKENKNCHNFKSPLGISKMTIRNSSSNLSKTPNRHLQRMLENESITNELINRTPTSSGKTWPNSNLSTPKTTGDLTILASPKISPLSLKNSQAARAEESQLSITQMLGMINDIERNVSKYDSPISKIRKKSGRIATDSESEFETSLELNSSKKSKLGLIKKDTAKATTSRRTLTFDSDDDFELPSSPIIKSKKKARKPLKLVKKAESNRKTAVNPFIELEADVSSEDGTVSEDEDSSGDDVLESSFVNDETQNFGNDTQMHAHYLQSTRSPHLNKGRFKIPQKPKINYSEVFSQACDIGINDSYLNDSFCVGSQEAVQDEVDELSELEIAEKILNKERKRKKHLRDRKSKRKCIIISDDSD